MRITIEKLRVLLVAGAAVLALSVGGFLALAHHRAHQLLHDLPARLGADIQKETNGFTYSQAVQGRTVFTIHAARAVQHRDGKVTLHDVGIVLYGREENRADRIEGKEFEYDQKEGVVRAAGEVHLDLQARVSADARSRAAYSAGSSAESGKAEGDPELVHARTSGLVYVQRLGVASTAEEIEFTYRGVSGRAHGGAFNADTGAVVLEHDVQISGVHEGRPMLLTASHAEMSKGTGVLLLNGARTVRVGETRSGGNGREEATAGVVRVSLRADGSVQRVEADSGVSFQGEQGIVRAPRAEVVMDAAGHPATARMLGGMTYRLEQPQQDADARAAEGMFQLDEHGRIAATALAGDVILQTRSRAAADTVWGSEREMHASRVNLRFARGSDGRRVPDEATAEGGARVLLRETAIGGHPPEQTEMSADRMTAHFDRGLRATQLSRLEARGQTVLERRSADGASDRSTGDAMEIHFAPPGVSGSRRAGGGPRPRVSEGATDIESAVQRGSVVLQHNAMGPDRRPETLHAGAREAQFDGTDRLLLLGDAVVTQKGSTLRARQIDLSRSTGDGTAQGEVQVTYAQAGSADLVHVIGDRAEFTREGGAATFHGGASWAALVRAWQGGSQIEAPTLTLRQAQGELTAYGAEGAAAGQVHTTLSQVKKDARADASKGATAAERGRAAASRVVRVTSGRLEYNGAAHRADFTRGVLLEDGDGSMRSDRATAFLRGEAGAPKRPGVDTGGTKRGTGTSSGTAGAEAANGPGEGGETVAGFPRGGLDRILATGNVVLRQPGREATGEQIVYTAADGLFTLTGTASTPPSVTDAVNGTVRGSSIQFHSGDNSVVVSGDPARGSAGRVRSEIKVKTE